MLFCLFFFFLRSTLFLPRKRGWTPLVTPQTAGLSDSSYKITCSCKFSDYVMSPVFRDILCWRVVTLHFLSFFMFFHLVFNQNEYIEPPCDPPATSLIDLSTKITYIKNIKRLCYEPNISRYFDLKLRNLSIFDRFLSTLRSVTNYGY